MIPFYHFLIICQKKVVQLGFFENIPVVLKKLFFAYRKWITEFFKNLENYQKIWYVKFIFLNGKNAYGTFWIHHRIFQFLPEFYLFYWIFCLYFLKKNYKGNIGIMEIYGSPMCKCGCQDKTSSMPCGRSISSKPIQAQLITNNLTHQTLSFF